MEITDQLIVQSDVIFAPIANLPAYVREQLVYEEGDYVITRPRSRVTSRIVDAQCAELLRIFEVPMTFVQAVIRFSQANRLDPERVLTEAFPTIQSLLHESFLVPASSEHAQPIVPTLTAGERVANCEVLSCIHLLDDTEVYQVKRAGGEIVALKISRPGGNPEMLRLWEREASILKLLDGKVNPMLLEAGVSQGRPYLITEWCSGVEISVAAQQLRRHSGDGSRRKLLLLCCTVLDAFSHLHSQGIIHADIHPSNIFVESGGSVKVIDYAFAYQEGVAIQGEELRRTDISYFSEPEHAKAVLANLKVPAPNTKGEQFSLAAILYYLITGAHYLESTLEREEILYRITAGNPLPFSRWGITPWPEVETLLATALSKRPVERFPTVSAFASSLKGVIVVDEQPDSSLVSFTPHTDVLAAQKLLDGILKHVGLEGPLLASGLTTAPTCSLARGAAGIAYALYRIACAQNEAALLSLADVWSTQAANRIQSDAAFYNEAGIIPETFGSTSPYHTASGVYCVQALIGHAMGNEVLQQEAISTFIAVSRGPYRSLDLTLGSSGTLLVSSFLLDITATHSALNAAPLLALGNEVLQSIWDKINTLPALRECSEITYLGIAHGWAGILYATMSWCHSSRAVLPVAVEERLQQLLACAESNGRGVRWKSVLSRSGHKLSELYMPGWCNGSAGYIHLWTLAHRMFGDEMYARLAEQSAWNAWEESDTVSILCCGLAGQAYGLLNLYKHTGEKAWLARAQELAQRAALRAKDTALHNTTLRTQQDVYSHSLYHGDVGIAVLIADLAAPEDACMPFFERERWAISPS